MDYSDSFRVGLHSLISSTYVKNVSAMVCLMSPSMLVRLLLRIEGWFSSMTVFLMSLIDNYI